MDVYIVAGAAFLGAMGSGLLGWSQQDPPVPFALRKYVGTIIRAVIGAAGVAVAFNYANFAGALSYLTAFIAGAGIDAGGSRISGSVVANIKK